MGGKDAVLIFQKERFYVEGMAALFSHNTKLIKQTSSDIYHFYKVECDPSLNSLKVKIIYPASQKDIKDFQRSTSICVRETPQIYMSIIKPYIQSIPESRTKWIDNILAHHPASDQAKYIFYEDDEFVLVPDTKWDRSNLNQLWCLAIVKDKNLKSIRDLNSSHLPLLKSIHQSSLTAIEKQYRLKRSEILVFVQYLPSFFHLHIHFAHFSRCGGNRMILVEDIIQNIHLAPQYYLTSDLTILVGDHMDLYQPLKAHLNIL
uniref:HIT domain-containing protein n=1 Tax=Arcella intermedia TaxID=1963864 RepID=A0A6B2LF57_9EUKA